LKKNRAVHEHIFCRRPNELINNIVLSLDLDTMTSPDQPAHEFKFLRKKALDLGAVDAKIIPIDKIYVEHRVTLKCRAGCIGYGKKLTCPPHVPTVDEFRKILKEYRYALLVKFQSPAVADKDVAKAPYKTWLDPEEPAAVRDKAAKFWSDYFDYSKIVLSNMLELEKAAFNQGYTFALAFVNGSCRLCEKCNLEEGICRHPSQARIPEHAVGINMKKTADKAGLGIKFPIEGSPDAMALLLID